MHESVTDRFESVKRLANEIMVQLHSEVVRLGFSPDEITLKSLEDADYRLEKDPSNAEFSLAGYWNDDRGAKLGCLLFHSDGTFYVEQDIVRPHPVKKKWFVEAVNAWGKEPNIKVESRLLPMPE